MMDYKVLVIGFLIGLILGVFITTFKKKDGLLRVHWDEDDGEPYLFLELDEAPEKVIRKKFVIFKVKEDSR